MRPLRCRRYLVRYVGTVLVTSSRNPEFDACRVLLAQGISGKLEVWHKGAPFPSVCLDIAKGASLTVEESDRIGLRFARWQLSVEAVRQGRMLELKFTRHGFDVTARIRFTTTSMHFGGCRVWMICPRCHRSGESPGSGHGYPRSAWSPRVAWRRIG